MSIRVVMPSTSTPDRGSSRIKMLGMGSRARASSTRCSSPPERVPTRLCSRSTPCTRSRHSQIEDSMALLIPQKAGRLPMQQVKRSATSKGSPGSKVGLWGT